MSRYPEEFDVRGPYASLKVVFGDISDLPAKKRLRFEDEPSGPPIVSKDKVFISIHGGRGYKEITSRQNNLSDMQRALVQEAIWVAREQLSPEKAQRAIAKLKALFSPIRPLNDMAVRLEKLPTTIENMISKQTMLSRLRDDPMFYSRKDLVQPEARANPEYAMMAIKQRGTLLIDAPETIKNNKEIVLAALRSPEGREQADIIYSSASNDLKAEWDVITALIGNNAAFVRKAYSANKKLFDDPDFIAHIINGAQKLLGTSVPLLVELFDSEMQHLPIFKDNNVVHELIPLLDISHRALGIYALFVFASSPDAWNARDLALAFAQRGILDVLPDVYKGDKIIVRASLEGRVSNFEYATKSLKEDKVFVMELLKSGIPNIEFIYNCISFKLTSDEAVVLQVIKNGGEIDLTWLYDTPFMYRVTHDEELFLKVVPSCPWLDIKYVWGHLGENLAKSREVLKAIIQHFNRAIEELSEIVTFHIEFLEELKDKGYISREEFNWVLKNGTVVADAKSEDEAIMAEAESD